MTTHGRTLFELDFEISRDDYEAFQRFLANTPGRRQIGPSVWMVIASLPLFGLWWATGARESLAMGVATLCFAALVTIYRQRDWQATREGPFDDGSVLGARTLSVMETGFSIRSAEIVSTVSWHGVVAVVVHDACVYLFVDRISAMVVSTRGLDQEALDRFVALVSEQLAKTREPAPDGAFAGELVTSPL